jgi:alanyl-tRNA synthetase
MERKELIAEYFAFFKSKQHKIIPAASLIPENDPTVLFTTAGMHPLVPYLLGQKHPEGKRLADVQPCIRTGDIDSVGDVSHLTFFEMLGNWSLGDYWKKEAIEWSFEFLTQHLRIKKEDIHVTVFAGDEDASRDEESARIWQQLGIPKSRIYYLGKDENWWGPAGSTGPCGPCTEMFIDTGKPKCNNECRPSCDCGKYFEVWNDVFMEYNKTTSGKYVQLKQRNVDTGMGVERTIAMLQKKKSVYETEVFVPIINQIKEVAGLKGKNLTNEQERCLRIIADHLKAATFILAENIQPSNLERGYVLRRLIRKSIRYANLLGIKTNFTKRIAEAVIGIYKQGYKHLERNKDFIFSELENEEKRFNETLERGLKKFELIVKQCRKKISGKDAFLLFQSFGFPIEMTLELAKERGLEVDEKGFHEEYKKHQEISRKATIGIFKSGLADKSEETTKLHTATHLLHAALREVLGKHVQQKGSNITAERLRFDFTHDKKLTDEEIKKVENLVNKKIQEALPVIREEMSLEEAKKKGALAFFSDRYAERVSVYSIGNFSKEVCAGPHVDNTSKLAEGNKKFKIIKEESVAAGIRRIKAILE